MCDGAHHYVDVVLGSGAGDAMNVSEKLRKYFRVPSMELESLLVAVEELEEQFQLLRVVLREREVEVDTAYQLERQKEKELSICMRAIVLCYEQEHGKKPAVGYFEQFFEAARREYDEEGR